MSAGIGIKSGHSPLGRKQKFWKHAKPFAFSNSVSKKARVQAVHMNSHYVKLKTAKIGGFQFTVHVLRLDTDDRA